MARPYCPTRAYHATRVYNGAQHAATALAYLALATIAAALAYGVCNPTRVAMGAGMLATGLAMLALVAVVQWVGAWYYRRHA